MSLAINANGLSIDTTDEILAELVSTAESIFGASIQASNPNSVIGQLLSGEAQQLLQMQEGLDGVYQSGFLDGAQGVNLDRLAQLVGLSRLPATATTVAMVFHNSNAGNVVIPAGALVQLLATGATFAVVASVTAPGTGTIAGVLRAVETGPTVVGITTVTGWSNITAYTNSTFITMDNAAAGTTGTNQETDGDFRLRIEQSAHLPGRTTLDAIRAAVRAVSGIVEANVFENTSLVMGITTPVTIALLPGKSFVAVTRGGDSTAIAQAIYNNKPAGIATFGSTTVPVADTDGYAVPISFQIAASTTVTVNATLAGVASATPYAAAIKAAVISYMDSRSMGQPVIFDAVLGAVFSNAGISCTGVTLLVGGVGTNFAIDWDHYALTTNGDITLLP